MARTKYSAGIPALNIIGRVPRRRKLKSTILDFTL